MTIENAKITGTKLEIVGGNLTGWVFLEFKGGGVGFGGRVLSVDSNEMSNGFGSRWIHKVIQTVGADSWEELTGCFIRVNHEGWGGKVKEIGHIVEDKWFSQEYLAQQFMED